MNPEIEYLKSQIAALRNEMRVRPIIYSRPPAQVRSKLAYIVGGNALTWVGLSGIKKVTTHITSITGSIDFTNQSPAILPDGCGWCRWLDDNSYFIALNDSLAYTQYDLIPQVVYAGIPDTVSNGATVIPVYRVVGIV